MAPRYVRAVVNLAALAGVIGSGCSCGTPHAPDASMDASLDAARDVGPPDARWLRDTSVFVPRDGGALSYEPCAEDLRFTTIAWPDPLLALDLGAGRLYGQGERLSVTWRTGDPFDPDTAIAWATFSTTTSRMEVLRSFRSEDPVIASPAAIGGGPEDVRLYLATRDEPRALGVVEASVSGESPFLFMDSISSPYSLNGVIAGETIGVAGFAAGDGSSPYLVRLGSDVRRYPMPSGFQVDSMLLSDDERRVAFTAREVGTLRQLAGVLDLESGANRVVEVPADSFAGEPQSLVAVHFPNDGATIVGALSVSSGRIQLAYLWLDAELSLVGSWTVPVSFRDFPPVLVPAVRQGHDVLLTLTAELGGRYPLYAGLSSGPGIVRGASRPIAILPSRPWSVRAWATGADAVVAFAASELSVLRLRCVR